MRPMEANATTHPSGRTIYHHRTRVVAHLLMQTEPARIQAPTVSPRRAPVPDSGSVNHRSDPSIVVELRLNKSADPAAGSTVTSESVTVAVAGRSETVRRSSSSTIEQPAPDRDQSEWRSAGDTFSRRSHISGLPGEAGGG
jgi:hypothetical protein